MDENCVAAIFIGFAGLSLVFLISACAYALLSWLMRIQDRVAMGVDRHYKPIKPPVWTEAYKPPKKESAHE